MRAEDVRVFMKVRTPDGVGKVVGITMPHTAVMTSPERAEVVVWYGIENPQNGWISSTYPIREISPEPG